MQTQSQQQTLQYYMLNSGIDGFAPMTEVSNMPNVFFSRPASQAEAEEWDALHALNEWIAA